MRILERMPGDARIINSRGVPGTVGFLAIIPHEAVAVLVTSHHVLFGAGAGAGQPVWLDDDGSGDTGGHRLLGHTGYGTLGTVSCDGAEYHVDCAVARLDSSWLGTARMTTAPAALGAVVTKTGAATGTTVGVVVDTAHSDMASIDDHPWPTPRQLLVAPRAGAFSAEGDSGALLRDQSGSAIGLLWGTTARGEGVACHIRPVLKTLGVVPYA